MTTFYVLSALAISFFMTCASDVMALMRKNRSKMAGIYLGNGWAAVQFTFLGGWLSFISYSIWGVLNIGWIALVWMSVVTLVKEFIHMFYDRLQYILNPSAIVFHQVVLAFCSIIGFLITIILNLILWMWN
jgi:hypothetical protein